MNVCEFCGREFRNAGALATHRRTQHINPTTHCPKGHPYDETNTIRCTAKDGRRYRKCAECVRLLWQDRKDQYTRHRRGNPDEIRRQKEREDRRFREDPSKAMARRQVNTAVRNGTLIKPDACERCGVTGQRLDGSHDDYSRPLDVEWLCRKCHGAKDRRLAPIDPPSYKTAGSLALAVDRLPASNTHNGALRVSNTDDAIPAADELLGVGHQASLLESDSTLETVPTGADTPGASGRNRTRHLAPYEASGLPEVSDRHQPDCALCGLKARMWSGVTDWMDEDGKWIGWCTAEHRRRWLNGERLAHRRSDGAQTNEGEQG